MSGYGYYLKIEQSSVDTPARMNQCLHCCSLARWLDGLSAPIKEHFDEVPGKYSTIPCVPINFSHSRISVLSSSNKLLTNPIGDPYSFV